MFNRQQRNGIGDGQKVLKLNSQRGNLNLVHDHRNVTKPKALQNQTNLRADVEKVEVVKGELNVTVAVRGKVIMKGKLVMINERET